jgi:hypothetical protein
MRRIRPRTAEELEKEKVWRAKIDADALARAQQICGQVLLAKLAKSAKQHEALPRVRVAEAQFCDTFTDPADGDLFVKALQAMVRGGFFVESAEGWDCLCTQADLKRFCGSFDFNKWTLLARYFTVNKKRIKARSLTSQNPPEIRGGRKLSGLLSADATSRWPAMVKALQACELLIQVKGLQDWEPLT